jgi:hypothetical protein
MSQIQLHPGQSEVYTDLFVENAIRFAVVVASRGWGKSYFAATSAVSAVWELMKLNPRIPNKNVVIIAPTYSQVTDIYYPLIAYQLGMERYALKSSRNLGRFWFPNDIELKLLSYEAIERLRGTGVYFSVLDEVSTWEGGVGLQEAWQSIIEPCISTRWSPRHAQIYKSKPGRAVTISTPKGYTFLHDMFNFHEHDPMWKSYHYDYSTSPFLDPSEIERVKHTIDPLRFNREYKALFEESGNTVFYCFDRKIHVDKNIPDFRKPTDSDTRDGEDVHVFIDFNVNIQASSIWALRGNQLFAIDELKGHSDTEQLAIALSNRYKGHRIFAYPDPAGRARKTSATVGVTDFSILEKHGITTRAHSKAPPIVDSVNAVNRMLKTAAGDINMYFHPRCQNLIASMERTVWLESNPNSATIDKSEGAEHYSDGVRYGVEYMFPITAGTKKTARGFGF